MFGWLPYNYRPKEIWYKIKCFVWHRYTTIKSRYLDHTWHDRVAVLPHTMFEVLSRFIEGECSPGHVDWEGSGHTVEVSGETVNVRDEMQNLYDWWHTVYNKEFREVDQIIWKEAQKHEPTEMFVPYKPEEDEEGKEGWMEYDPQFPNEEDKEIYNSCMMALSKLERTQEKMLMERMHRLVNLTPYLWT